METKHNNTGTQASRIPEIVEEVLSLHRDGLNPTAISTNIRKSFNKNISKDTVKGILSKNNLVPHSRTEGYKKDQYENFVKEVLGGEDWSKIRKKFKISFEKAKSILIANGIVPSSRIDASKKKTLSEEEVVSRIKDPDVTYLGFENKKYHFVTKDGREFSKTSAKIKQGNPFGKCGKPAEIEEITKDLKGLGYDLIPESYVKKREAFKAICLKCKNIREARYINFFEQSCATCSNTGVSLAEKDMGKWVESFGYKTEKLKLPANKTRAKEIDIYIEELKIGIEYCGLYWHCENSKSSKDRDYHKNKLDTANGMGIRLITIFEDEWKEREFQTKSFLTSLLKKNSVKIGARDCIVQAIGKNEASLFIDDFHIQGKGKSFIYIGIKNKEELLGVMSFSRHHRQNSKEDVAVLDRLVFRAGVTVSGGASKMLKYSTPFLKAMGFTKIVSWSDNRWSDGNVYKAMGFQLEEDLSPDYAYVKSQKRFSKQSLKKTKEEQKLDKTEFELRREQGYDWIWDCGKKRWCKALL